jgi:hypothetical protein
MREEILNGFYESLNVKTRPGRGGNYPYVTADDVTDRMNKLFKGNWSTMVTFQDVVGGNVIVRVRVEVTNDEDGKIYSHEGFGGQKEDPSAEPGNVFKSAYSKAIVSACRRWGVGLYLEEEAPAPPTMAMPPIKTGQDTWTTTGIEKIKGEAEKKTPVVPVPVSTFPVKMPTEVKPPPGLSGVPAPPPVTAGIKIDQALMPKIPVPIPGIKMPAQAPEEPISPPGVLATDETIEEGMVNDVQKISIESLIKMRGVPYPEMAQGALGRIPDVNTLTHAEAVAVIKHGNDLYKKNKQK